MTAYPAILYPARPVLVKSLDIIKKRPSKTWRVQIKFGGHHLIVSTSMPGYQHSRHGTPLSSANGLDISTECAKIFGLDCVLDGEFVGPAHGKPKDWYYVIWDMPVKHGKDITRFNYLARLAILAQHHTDFKEFGRIRVSSRIWLAGVYNVEFIDAIVRQCDGRVHEGIVAKDISHNLSWSRIAQVECTAMLKYRMAPRSPAPLGSTA